MSESISMAQEPPQPAKDSSENSKEKQSSKVVLITALMTAITTVGVSFIGIVPQLRRGDSETITELRKEFNLLKEKSGNNVNTPTPVMDKKMNIYGTVKTEDGKRELSGFEVYLLPEGNNLLTAKTDDRGVFNFKDIPAGTYSIIVRDSAHGNSGKGMLDESEDEVTVKGAKIKYRIRQ